MTTRPLASEAITTPAHHDTTPRRYGCWEGTPKPLKIKEDTLHFCTTNSPSGQRHGGAKVRGRQGTAGHARGEMARGEGRRGGEGKEDEEKDAKDNHTNSKNNTIHNNNLDSREDSKQR